MTLSPSSRRDPQRWLACCLLVSLVALTLASSPVAALGSSPVAALASESYLSCEAEPAIQALLDRADVMQESCEIGGRELCWRKAEEMLRPAIETLPRDYFLQRYYQSLFNLPFGMPLEAYGRLPELEKRYADLAEQHPDDAVFLDLYAHMLPLEDPHREQLLRRAAERAPNSPWAQRALMGLALRVDEGEEPDLEMVRTTLRQFLDQCPAQLDVVGHLYRKLPEVDFWNGPIEAARSIFSADPARHWQSFDSLWRLQFKVADAARHPALRERIRGDVERLETLDLRDDDRWWHLLQVGYELAGDTDRSAELEATLAEREPCGKPLMEAIIGRGREEMLARQQEDFDEDAYLRANREYFGNWLERCPNSTFVLREFLAAQSQLEDTDPSLLEELGERLLALSADQSSPAELTVAAMWQRKGIQKERVPELLRTSESKLQRTEVLLAELDLERIPEHQRERLLTQHERIGWHARSSLARQWAQIGNFERSHELLEQLQLSLEVEQAEAVAQPEGESEPSAFDPTYYEQLVWTTLADVAELEEHFVDAAVYLRRVYSVRPQAEVAERAKELWIQGGGGEQAWTSLDELGDLTAAERDPQAELAEQTKWTAQERPLPAFELTDVRGRKWALSELQGKTVFVNFWATWCFPCVQELPLVQELNEQLAERDDVVLVTLNVDDNAGLVAPFLEKNEYDFPVLLGVSYFDQIGGGGIPRNWVIDGQGTLRAESVGYSSMITQEQWLDAVHQQLEEASASSSSNAKSNAKSNASVSDD